MLRGQFSLVLLSAMLVIPTLVFSQTIPVTEVKQGENVTLTCNVTGQESGLFYWYKMKCGYLIQTVVTGYFESVNLDTPFKIFSFKFEVIKVGNVYSLIIRNIQKEDEAIYCCQAGAAYKMAFINVMKLEVSSSDVKQTQKTPFGIKTTTEKKSNLDSVVIGLGVLCALCVIVIAILVFLRD